jgi:YNFM family putative membrane transporter
MPELAKEFNISPAVASLSLSMTTIAMAVSMLFVGFLSDAVGRKSIMTVSIITASILAVLTALSPDYHLLLLIRVVQGIVLAGLPAIAMTYLSEEIEPAGLGLAMGLYISGNSIGGMSGRIICGIITDYYNWRVAIAAVGTFGLAAAIMFWLLLPPSKNFKREPVEIKKMLKILVSQCKDPNLLTIYGLGFLFMSCFVTLFNYISFQLLAPPYSLSQSIVGWIFIINTVGTVSSTWMAGWLINMADTRL